jgi:acetyltransferase-like isoleucine patch superfamily enzyme
MLLFIKKTITKVIVKLVKYGNMRIHNFKIENIRSVQNVAINDNVLFDSTINISLDPDILNLTIEENFICRQYCSLLLYKSASLVIRRNVFLNSFCSINCLNSIEVGENTLFGEGVKIYDHNHKYEFLDKQLFVHRDDFSLGKVKIGSNCWIGSNVTILKDVTIGDNVIVGANCLIYKSIPSNSIVKHKEELIIN